MSKKGAERGQEGSSNQEDSNKPVATALRHGGRAGKDSFTEVAQEAFLALVRNRFLSLVLVVLLLAVLFGGAWLHKISNDKATETEKARIALLSAIPSAELGDLQQWLKENEEASGQIEIRLLLIKKYRELAYEKADPAPLELALSELNRLRSDFGDHPLASAPMIPSDTGLGVDRPTFLNQLEGGIQDEKTKLSATFKSKFRPAEESEVPPAPEEEPADPAPTPPSP